jgi:hypothetical protein
MPTDPRGRPWLAGLALFAACALLRLGLVDRQGLWADEVFSLAIATGHSLEQPAAASDGAKGDYVEAPRPLPPSAYSRYLEHDRPPAGPGRVVRATFLSDTSPPLYYLLLYAWTRVLGTGDAALRLFSVAWALACFPVVWSLARQVGGRAAAFPACVLFTLAPDCVFYSTEGRMYSLLWFWTVGTMWLTLRLWRRGFRPATFVLWVAAGAAGLLTHYFFAFAWAAGLAWLLLHPGRLPRKLVWAGAALVGLLVLPWYACLPASLANWRVTAYWLRMRPEGYHPVLAFLLVPWSFLSVSGTGGIRPWLDGVTLGVYLALAVAAWRKLSWSLFRPRRQLLWLWLLGPCLGLVAFDLLRGTYVLAVPRYALAGMPAAFLLVGLVLGRLKPRGRGAFLALIALACLAGDGRIYRNEARHSEPIRQVGWLLSQQTGPSDLVIVHSIPSGVTGVARYVEEGGGPGRSAGFVSWVGQLEQRHVSEDLPGLVAGRRRVVLVKVHEVGEPAPEEDWLRGHAKPDREHRLGSVRALYFVTRDAGDFAAPRQNASTGR